MAYIQSEQLQKYITDSASLFNINLNGWAGRIYEN